MIAFREGDDWHRVRKALASKMLRPKDVRDNMENFTAVTRDAIEHMVSIRGADMEIPDLSKELAQWATECKCLEAGVLIQLPGQLNWISAALPRIEGGRGFKLRPDQHSGS